ncbi:MAG: hypothetical protein CM15mV3_2370 [Caudoviricetes sp.]|nr:MAG: hypothetical protein CM15mV3_2370 [Caudoviricetes sp.]
MFSPMKNQRDVKSIRSGYDNAYTQIHHFETIKIGQFPAGLHVDETF